MIERAWGWYALALFALIVAALWPIVVLAPTRRLAHAAARAGSRTLLRATATPLQVDGLEHLAELRDPLVLVANHTSEVDGIALAAGLRRRFAVVAKVELRRHVGWRWPLARLGTLFVQRGAAGSVPSQTELAVARLRAGDSLLFFPEATFRRRPGVLPFHRGAFVAAARAGVPVVPIACTGARAMTPAEGAPPRRGAIRLEIGAPLWPLRGVDPSAAALALRHAARAFILARTGERALRR